MRPARPGLYGEGSAIEMLDRARPGQGRPRVPTCELRKGFERGPLSAASVDVAAVVDVDDQHNAQLGRLSVRVDRDLLA